MNGRNGSREVAPIKRKRGRPTARTSRIERVILGRLCQGKSLNKILRNPRLPTYSTVMDWVLDDKEFSEKYEISRAKQAEFWADQIVDLSDQAEDKDSAAAARIKIDARKWVACKLLPRKYGDKPAEINVSNSVHNHLHITEADLRQIQEERQKFLAGEAR